MKKYLPIISGWVAGTIISTFSKTFSPLGYSLLCATIAFLIECFYINYGRK
jgi:hypothetical protein